MDTHLKTHSLLANTTSAELILEPYPHITVKKALPYDYYRILEDSYPSVETLTLVMRKAASSEPDNKNYGRTLRHLGKRNRRVNIPSGVAIGSEHIAPVWQQFIDYHSSNEFYHQMVSVFAPAIRDYFPEFQYENSQASRRNSVTPTEISVDSMIAMNTPSWFGGSITGPHTDHPNKLFVGLFYMKHPDDNSGGDLHIYRRTEPVTKKNLKWPDKTSVELNSKVEYAPNTFVLMLNTAQSVHGVSSRKKSKLPRRFVNIVAERSQPFFKV